MRHATKPALAAIALAALASCTSPSAGDDDPPADPPEGELGSEEPEREVGLPESRADSSCLTPTELDFGDWVHGPDAIVVGVVEDVRFNRDLVFSGSKTPTEQISWDDCEQPSVVVSLTVRFDGAHALAGSAPDGPFEVTIGTWATRHWIPRPYWDAGAGALAWGGEGAVLGAGVRLGMGLFWDEHWKKWSAQQLFEVEQDDSLSFARYDEECLEIPPQLTSTTLADLEADIATAATPAESQLSRYREWHMPTDDDTRAYDRLATTCIEADAPLEPPPRDPEANP